MFNDFKELHPRKAAVLIERRELGKLIDVNDVHPWKAYSLMTFKVDTPSNVTLFNDVHAINADCPIDVTVDLMITVLSEEQPIYFELTIVESDILITVGLDIVYFLILGTLYVVSVNVVQLSNMSGVRFVVLVTAIEISLLQPWNALLLIIVTDGSVTDTNDVHPENELWPIVVTAEALILLREEQSLKT